MLKRLLSVSALASALVLAAVLQAPPARAAGEAGSWVLMDGGGLITDRFGSSGSVYITGAQTGGGLIPASDFYVVPDRDWAEVAPGSPYSGLDVTNPSRTPNTYIGWQVVREPLWFGTLRVGGFDVVVDRDQDGVFSENDEIIGYGTRPGFTVTHDGSLSALQKAALKDEHGARWGLAASLSSIGVNTIEAIGVGEDVSGLAQIGFDIAEAVEVGSSGAWLKLTRAGTSFGVGMITREACDRIPDRSELGFACDVIGGPTGIATEGLKDAAEDFRAAAEAIYLDPPDHDYEAVSPRVPPAYVSETAPTPTGVATAKLTNRLADASAWSDALLHAIERHDGAAIDGDRAGMRRQAEAVAEFSDGLGAALDAVDEAARAADAAFVDAGLHDKYAAIASGLAELKTRLSDTGFTSDELAQFSAAGISQQVAAQARQQVLNVQTPEEGFGAHFARMSQDAVPSRDALWELAIQARNVVDAIDAGAGSNRPPVAVDDSALVGPGDEATIMPLGNDNDPEGEPLTLEIITPTSNGALDCAEISCLYTPEPGFVGTDSFTYRVLDHAGLASATATVKIQVTGAGVVAIDDRLDIHPGGRATLDVLANDLVEGSAWISSSTEPEFGTADCEELGSACHYKASQESGTDSFQYTIMNDAGEESSATVYVEIDGTGAAPIVFFQASDVTVTEGSTPGLPFVAYDADSEIASYAWSTTRGWSSADAEPPIAEDDGPVVYTLTVVDETGDSTSASIAVDVVNAAPELSTTILERAPVGSTISYSASASDLGNHDNPTVWWRFDGEEPVSGLMVTRTWPVRGSFEAEVWAEDKDGARSEARSWTVSVADVVADAGVHLSAEEGTDVAFDFSGSTPMDDALRYEVDFGDGSKLTQIDDLRSVRHPFLSAGEYTVTLTAVDLIDIARGEVRTVDTTRVTVANVAPTIVGIARGDARAGGETGLRLFWSDPGGTDGATVTWSLDGEGAIGDEVSHVFAAGSRPVTVSVADRSGARVSKSFTLDVRAETPDRSTRGRDFWLAFDANHVLGGEDGTRYLRLFITGDGGTEGIVEIPGLGFTSSFAVGASGVGAIDVPIEAMVGIAATEPTRMEPRAIRVSADAEVSVYGLNRLQFSTDAFLAHPTDAAGARFRVLDYASSTAGVISVVATEGPTSVIVTPPADSGLAPFRTTVRLGDVFQWEPEGGATLTGTLIESDGPIIVSAGNRCTTIPSGTDWCDHIVEQMHPTSTWGRTFVTLPLAMRTADTFRVVADAADTAVTIVRSGGVEHFTLNAGEYREFLAGEPQTITATAPISVAQYANGATFDDAVADPFMALVAPYEQGSSDVTFATPAEGFTNYVNITIPAAAVSSVRLDGENVDASAWRAIPGSFYAGAALPITPGTHTVTAAVAMQSLVYGFGVDDSYGYPGGTRTADIALADRLTVSPKMTRLLAGEEQCVSAALVTADGTGIPGARVDFTTSGVVSRLDEATTGSNGIAAVCLTSDVPGSASVRTSVGDLTDTATITWDSDAPPANSPPVAALKVTGDPVEGGSVVLDASASSDADGDPLTYSWDLNGDGVFDDTAGESALLELPIAGNYSAAVRVFDGRSRVDEERATVTAVNVVPVVSLGDPVTIRYPAVLEHAGSFVDPGNDDWTATVDRGSGPEPLALSGNDFRLSVADLAPGEHEIVVSVRDERGGSTGTARLRVTVDPGVLIGGVPVVTGDAVVGGTLSVEAGEWGPSPVRLSYRWLVDGEPVDGATGTRYVIQPTDVGRTVTAEVTGARRHFAAASAVSASVGPVAPGVLEPTAPNIDGVPVVGGILTAVVSPWAPGAVTLHRQWAADGIDIPGATGISLVPSAEHEGARITVRVTGEKHGYSAASRTSDSVGPVSAATIEPIFPGTPAVVGIPRIGESLSVDPGAWAPDGVMLAYQWLVDGVPIPGEDGTSFAPRPDDIGRLVSVLVRGERLGHEAATAVSPEVGPVEYGVIRGGTPFVRGEARPGATVVAVTSEWTPADATLFYQWMTNGAEIEGATAREFVVPDALAGTSLAVRVTAVKTGYTELARISDQTMVASPPTALDESSRSESPARAELPSTGSAPPSMPFAAAVVLIFSGALLLHTRRRLLR